MENIVITEELKSKLEQAESLEALIKVLAEEGIEITMEELKKLMAEEEGELDENALDDVAGGAVLIGALGRLIWEALKRMRPVIGGPIKQW